MPEDPAVAALIAKASQAKTNREALEASLLLERFIYGSSSTLDDPRQADRLQRNRADAEARDRAAEAFNRDAEGFVNGVFNSTEGKKLTGSKKEGAMASVADMKRTANQQARANQIAKQLELDWMIEHGPKRDVHATGKWTMVGGAGNSRPVLEPEVVRIMHRFYVLQPGLNKDVPNVFAETYDQITVSKAENSEREKAMGVSPNEEGVRGMEYHLLEAKLSDIDRRFNTKRVLPGG